MRRRSGVDAWAPPGCSPLSCTSAAVAFRCRRMSSSTRATQVFFSPRFRLPLTFSLSLCWKNLLSINYCDLRNFIQSYQLALSLYIASIWTLLFFFSFRFVSALHRSTTWMRLNDFCRFQTLINTQNCLCLADYELTLSCLVRAHSWALCVLWKSFFFLSIGMFLMGKRVNASFSLFLSTLN